MYNPFDFTGRRAIVTGGTRGIGHAMAEALLEQGATVVIWGTSDRVYEVANQFCKLGYHCHGVVVDLRESASRAAAFDQSLQLLGGLDILVNAAGVQHRHPAATYPDDYWNEIIEVNQTAPYHLCKLAGLVMIPQNHGKIINVASMLSFFGGNFGCAYSSSKGAIAQLTKSLCNEWAGCNIQINAIAPGYIATDLNAGLRTPGNPAQAEITQRIPAGHWGDPADMKGACLFLASQSANYVNGAILPVDGGYLVR